MASIYRTPRRAAGTRGPIPTISFALAGEPPPVPRAHLAGRDVRHRFRRRGSSAAGPAARSAGEFADVDGRCRDAWRSRFASYAVDVIGEPGAQPRRRGRVLRSDAYATWLTEVVGGLGLERFALGGISLGGWLALDYAWRRPETVDRLVLALSRRRRPIPRRDPGEDPRAEPVRAVGAAETARDDPGANSRRCVAREGRILDVL